MYTPAGVQICFSLQEHGTNASLHMCAIYLYMALNAYRCGCIILGRNKERDMCCCQICLNYHDWIKGPDL
jgi:hypothetical protein